MPSIVHIINGLETGGAEAMLFKLLNTIDRDRWTCSVISLKNRGTYGQRIESLGVPVHPLNVRGAIPGPLAAWRLRRAVRQLQPDIVQGWMYHGNIAATVARVLGSRRPPVVWNIRHSVHDLRYEKRTTVAMIHLGAALSKRTERIVFNSRVSARQHEAMGYDGSRVEVISNGFDCDRFAPEPDAHRRLADRLEVEKDDVLIGLIGRYHPMKDHAGFLRAAQMIARDRRDVHFVLAGRDVTVENRTISSQVRDLGIDTLVHVLGEVEEVAPLVAGLDILCSASAWGEGFPNVVGEAMACGVPCVVTDVGDSAWVVGGAGRVAPPGDPAALAAECRDLIEMGRQKRMLLGMAGRDRVLQQFSLQAVTRCYETLYSEMLAG